MKMLVGTDGSDHSYITLKKAAKIAKCMDNAEATIIYVDNTANQMIPSHAMNQIKEEKEKMERKILEEGKEVFENEGLKVDTMLEMGSPATKINNVATEGNYDIIVIGNKGHSGIERYLLGSVCNSIAQHADRDVYIVK